MDATPVKWREDIYIWFWKQSNTIQTDEQVIPYTIHQESWLILDLKIYKSTAEQAYTSLVLKPSAKSKSDHMKSFKVHTPAKYLVFNPL